MCEGCVHHLKLELGDKLAPGPELEPGLEISSEHTDVREKSESGSFLPKIAAFCVQKSCPSVAHVQPKGTPGTVGMVNNAGSFWHNKVPRHWEPLVWNVW